MDENQFLVYSIIILIIQHIMVTTKYDYQIHVKIMEIKSLSINNNIKKKKKEKKHQKFTA